MEDQMIQPRNTRRSYSIVGFAFALLLVVSFVAQLAFALIPKLTGWEFLNQQSWWTWFLASAPMYLFAFPACFLVLRFLPGQAPESKPLSRKQFFTLLPICFCLMYAGSLLGNMLSFLLSGGNAVNNLNSYAMDQHSLKILVMVILAPVLEELICRKLLIDRTVQYGEKLSVLMSGLIFGLLHGNLFQFFYAFVLGCLFAYVYVRTGRIRYTIIYHAIINFLGAVVAPAVLRLMDSEAFTGLGMDGFDPRLLLEVLLSMMAVMTYAMILMGLSVFGLVLLICKRRQLVWKEAPEQLPCKQALKSALLNAGMIVYGTICLVLIILALFNI